MALHLITGYKGTAHITPEDVGVFNTGTFGKGEYVLNTGNQFKTELVTNNEIKILDGDAMIQGRHISLKAGTYETITINNGEVGKTRHDLVVIRYTKNSQTGVENVEFVVKQGEPVSSNPADPEITKGDILSGGCLLHEFPLYRITVTEFSTGTPEPLFNVFSATLTGLQIKFSNFIKCGKYQGDGNASQFIPVGFTPVAVYVARADGRTVLHSDQATSTNTVTYYGGLALKDNPCAVWDTSESRDVPVVQIEPNGFRVYVSKFPTTSTGYRHEIRTNLSGNFHFIAINEASWTGDE